MMLEPESIKTLPLDYADDQIPINGGAGDRLSAVAPKESATKVARSGKSRKRNWQAIDEWVREQRVRPDQISPVDWSRVPAEERFFSVGDLRMVFSPTGITGMDFDHNLYTLCGQIAAGFIEARAVKIQYSTLVPNISIARLDQKWVRRSPGESQEHRDLKVLGICWLRKIGAQRAAAVERVFPVKWGSPVGILVLPFQNGSPFHYNGVLFTQGQYQHRGKHE